MAREHDLEVLSGALDGALRARGAVEAGDLSMEAVQANIKTANRLLDACFEAGMPHTTVNHFPWAAKRVARWLCEA
jgi:hypothetical protein